MAASTRSRVSSSTLVRPVDTRDTVWPDTPASRATSAIEGPRRRVVALPASGRDGVIQGPPWPCLREHATFRELPVYANMLPRRPKEWNDDDVNDPGRGGATRATA